MKRYRISILISLSIIFSFPLIISGEDRLPVTEIKGNQYYVYEVKKGESIYGIARKQGWDLDLLVSLNSNIADRLAKGDKLYYPVENATEEIKEDEVPKEIKEFEPIRHTVKKGETVYSISRQYNIPLETIYSLYPTAKYGVKVGEVLEFQQNPEKVSGGYYFYTVKDGDTLFSLARSYDTTVEDILKSNPGVSEKNFKSGNTIRIRPGISRDNTYKEIVTEEKVTGFDTYKVKKDDTWTSIAQSTGVEEDVLKDVNGENSLKQNENIAVPVISAVEVEKEIAPEDPRELSNEGIREIYDSIHGTESDVRTLERINVALLLDDPSSKKDIDFTRGFLIALKEKGKTPYKVDLKIFDGRVATSQLQNELEDFEPHLVVATADKAFPLFLADFGNTTGAEIVNVFDVRNDLYTDNASMVQLLPPSSIMNDNIADRLIKDYTGYRFIIVGEDETDGVASSLIAMLDENDLSKMQLSDFLESTIDDDAKIVVYSTGSKKEEVADLLQGIENLKESSPFADVILVGRQNWVLLNDDFADKFSQYGLILPSRVWLDTDSREWNNFQGEYMTFFGSEPVKSFPNFAASGYDTANFFIEAVVKNAGDSNRGFKTVDSKSLQTRFNLKRVNNWGGFVNVASCLLKYSPSGNIYVSTVD